MIHCPKIGGALVLLALATSPALAQQLAPAGAIPRTTASPGLADRGADTTVAARRDSLAARVPSRVARASRGALIGAGIGTIVGLVAASAATDSPSITDHSEDGYAYLFYGAMGTLFGILIGATVGASR